MQPSTAMPSSAICCGRMQYSVLIALRNIGRLRLAKSLECIDCSVGHLLAKLGTCRNGNRPYCSREESAHLRHDRMSGMDFASKFICDLLRAAAATGLLFRELIENAGYWEHRFNVGLRPELLRLNVATNVEVAGAIVVDVERVAGRVRRSARAGPDRRPLRGLALASRGDHGTVNPAAPCSLASEVTLVFRKSVADSTSSTRSGSAFQPDSS